MAIPPTKGLRPVTHLPLINEIRATFTPRQLGQHYQVRFDNHWRTFIAGVLAEPLRTFCKDLDLAADIKANPCGIVTVNDPRRTKKTIECLKIT